MGDNGGFELPWRGNDRILVTKQNQQRTDFTKVSRIAEGRYMRASRSVVMGVTVPRGRRAVDKGKRT